MSDSFRWESKGNGLHVLYYGAAECGLVASLADKYVAGVMDSGGDVIVKQYPFTSLDRAKSWVRQRIGSLIGEV